MTAAHLSRRALLLVLAMACLVSVVSLPDRFSPSIQPEADTSLFRAGNIISNAVFYDSKAMSATQIQSFLDSKGASCRPAADGPPCLKSYTMATPSRAADSYCPGGYTGSSKETAAQIIAKVGLACGINPRVLLVTLQKEMTLVTRSAPTAKMYTRAMGFGCPDSAGGTCDATYNGLFNQLYTAAKQFKRYAAKPTGYAHIAGLVNDVAFHPNAACGSSRVLIENQATASLYNYTPYQPNAQALAAGYGASTNTCSSYGNRNFWLWFTDWFGSTQTIGRDVDAPFGTLDQVGVGLSAVTVRGWAVDPNAPTTSIKVHVYVDGRYSGAVPANGYRPDVAAAFPGVGSAHGFSGSIVAAPGRHAVCVYMVNTGPGYTNPYMGCRTVTVGEIPAHNPVGRVDPLKVSALQVAISGWAIDPDAVTAPLRTHIYVDGRMVGALTADQPRDDVLRAYPKAGAAHGFTFSKSLPAGKHEICAYAINVGTGTANPQLGCKTVTLGGPPVGALEKVTAGPGQVRLVGWAIDPDTVDPISVHVFVDGQYKAAGVAKVSRPDVESVRPGYGPSHGFDISLPVPAGSRTLCVFGINVLSGSSNPVLGCRSVTVPATAFLPIGNVDSATLVNGKVQVKGWALDQDVPSQPLQVDVHVDGVKTVTVSTNQRRDDIELAYPGAGIYHGWSAELAVPSGTHTICAYALNIAGGSSNTKLPCKSVTVP